jgi:hypothetical protein
MKRWGERKFFKKNIEDIKGSIQEDKRQHPRDTQKGGFLEAILYNKEIYDNGVAVMTKRNMKYKKKIW